MSWQRRARAGLAVAGLAAAAAVFMLARDRVEPAPVSLEPADEDVEIECTGAMTQSQLSGSLERVRFSASGCKQMRDGSVWYPDVQVVFEDDGLTISSGEALMRAGSSTGEFGELVLSRDVTIETTDGLTLVTPQATYMPPTGIASMPGRVDITKGRLTATGVGGVYDRSQELFRLLAESHVSVGPGGDGTGEPVEASATSMTMARQEGFVRLEGQAVITRPTETLSADVATIYFVEGAEDIRLLDMRGRARVAPTEGAAGAPPAMRGDTVSMTFHPESRALQEATLSGNARLVTTEAGLERTVDAAWIRLRTGADGRTLTELAGRDNVVVTLPASGGNPAQMIRAENLLASGRDGVGLDQARFDGGVAFVETPAGGSPRTGESRVLTLALDGGFDAVDEAEFVDQVQFRAETLTASAARAVYRKRADELELFAGDGATARPHADGERLQVDATRMTLGLTSEAVRATGDVRTLTRPDPANADRPTALFAADLPVVGTADTFEYQPAEGRAIYQGASRRPARLLQEGNAVSGLRIIVREESGDLTAVDEVVAVFVLDTENDAGTTSPTTYTIGADRLDYVEASRVATFAGTPVTLESGEARSEADSIALTVAADSRQVESVFWRGQVYALLEGRYEAKGSTLLHTVATGAYRLEGTPAVTKLPTEGRSDCVRSIGSVTIFNRRTGRADWPRELNTRARLENRSMPCGDSIR